ncbi:hypothetical protein KP509_32G009600 [Ceratopteris richardii]|uniref:DNA/RNA-binding protein Alba-like domain-containing protein n=1 Tax=Ceratopteris richardii TaxID=49495 RepID=A0A8T2QSN8_CERRI|nr:hypothetical protein KP509_32G009600 [Ceratopteris richardii]KAH7286496.1 hypothetical protein KP509_32G009600 [Ceratopteris richardii]KAH7286497.1 hypothetical protein KP509_32G009600 [Ceratopteris richardii]
MERYQLVYKPRPGAPIKENEVRITTQGLMRNYISYASTLLEDKSIVEIVLKAMGRAISKAVMLTEIIKKRMTGLYQNISIGSLDITDVWEPLEEGLVPVETTRHVSMISITLSKKALDPSSYGYQPPSIDKRVSPISDSNIVNHSEGGVVAGRGRGSAHGQGRGRGMVAANGGYYNNYHGEEALSRGRGRGRGRGFRGGRRYNAGYMQTDAGRYEYGGYGGNGMPYGRGWGRGWEGARGQRQRGRGRGRGR